MTTTTAALMKLVQDKDRAQEAVVSAGYPPTEQAHGFLSASRKA
jgi:hypothetical protein